MTISTMSSQAPISPSSAAIVSMWLQSATSDLAPAARERVRVEIEAHFYDAVEHHLAGGRTEREAQMAALEELGDSETAAKRLRREHLTEKDAKNLGRALKYGNIASLFGSYFCFLVIVLVLYAYSSHQRNWATPGFLAAMALAGTLHATICFFVARSSGYKNRIRLLISLEIIIEIVFMIIIANCVTWVALPAQCIPLFRSVRLWLKLTRLPNCQEELPLSNKATVA